MCSPSALVSRTLLRLYLAVVKLAEASKFRKCYSVCFLSINEAD